MSAMAMGPAVPHLRIQRTSEVGRTVQVQAAPAAPRTAVATPSHLRLTSRGRVVLWLLAAVAVALVTLVGTRASADGPVGAQQVERHVVQPGETLWAIAEGVAAPSEDVRDVVFDLVRLNELPDAGLMAGQVIVVPVD